MKILLLGRNVISVPRPISVLLVGRADYGYRRVRFAHVVTHEVFLAVTPNVQIEHFRKRVYYR
jgi:hypothetical protein